MKIGLGLTYKHISSNLYESWKKEITTGTANVMDIGLLLFAPIISEMKISDKTNFPNLKEIVITGHSAGGQLAQHYAVGSALDQTYPEIHFRYVVANPGSYLYLTKKRPFKGPARCAYNDYKFGLDNLNPYMSKRPAAQMISDYLKKDVEPGSVILVMGSGDSYKLAKLILERL